MNMHKSISKRYEDFDTPVIDDKKISRITGRINQVSQKMKEQYSMKWGGDSMQIIEEKKKVVAKN